MRLLFDQNLSPRLVEKLADLYPNSSHVQDLDLAEANDSVIWEYARENNYTIVTKDADFHERRIFSGIPPNIIWIRKGNCFTQQIESSIREYHSAIKELSENERGFIIIR